MEGAVAVFVELAQMAMLRPYQQIVGMGMIAVPLILEELHREPDQWFWALECITEENPVPRTGRRPGKGDGRRLDPFGAEHGFVTP